MEANFSINVAKIVCFLFVEMFTDTSSQKCGIDIQSNEIAVRLKRVKERKTKISHDYINPPMFNIISGKDFLLRQCGHKFYKHCLNLEARCKW